MKFLFSFAFILCIMPCLAQRPLYNWNSLSLSGQLSKRWEIKAAHLRAFDINNGFQPLFHQTSMQVSYEPVKRLEIMAGALTTQSSNRQTWRYYLRGTHTLRLGKTLQWSNSLQAEKHSANETRFDYRLIYITRLGLRKRLDFLRLAPSVSYWLYYNIGGNPIAHYNNNGQLIGRSTADGLHRYRVQFNLNSKINQYVAASVYYMLQNEFNLGSNELKYMNVKNPSTGNTARRFDNFHVAGISLAFNLSIYNTK